MFFKIHTPLCVVKSVYFILKEYTFGILLGLVVKTVK
jgi:hypothetical protein